MTPNRDRDRPADAAAALAEMIVAAGSGRRHAERVTRALAGDDALLREILCDLFGAVVSGALGDVHFDSARFVQVIKPHLHPAPPAHDVLFRRCIVDLVDQALIASMASRFVTAARDPSLSARMRVAAAMGAYMLELELSTDELKPDTNPALEVVFYAQLADVLETAQGVEAQVRELAESVRAGRLSVADLSDHMPRGEGVELYAQLWGDHLVPDQDEVMRHTEAVLTGDHVSAVLSTDQVVALTAVLTAAHTKELERTEILRELIDDQFLDEVEQRLDRQYQAPGVPEEQRRAALQLRTAMDTMPMWVIVVAVRHGAPAESLEGEESFVDRLGRVEPPWRSVDLEPYQAFLTDRGEAAAAARIARTRELLDRIEAGETAVARGRSEPRRVD